MLLTVDLASKAWAACLGESGRVRREFSAWDFPSEDDAVAAITHLFRPESTVVPRWLIIEDMPFHLMQNVNGKDAFRFQGRIIQRMIDYGHKDKMLFVQPMEWQKHHQVVRAGDIGYAMLARERFGYKPPDLLTTYKSSYTSLSGKDRQDVRNKLKKLMTDYVAAFLIYRWAHEVKDEAMLNAKSVQRYTR